MLTLPTRTLGDLVLFDDPDAGTVHVARARPRVARRGDGSSQLRLLRWARTAGLDTTTPGGRLTLDLDVMPSTAELTAAGLSPAGTLPLPWLDATVRLEGPGFESLDIPVSIAAPTRCSVAVDLTPEAAALLAPLLLGETVSPLQVTWCGYVSVRLPPVEVIASADITEVRRRLSLVRGDTQSIITRSVIDANAHIEIRGAANAELERVLRDWVLDELSARVAQGRGLSVHASASDVVRWPVRLQTTLDDLASGPDRTRLVETVLLDETGFGRTPPVAVRVLADFSGPLDRVDVQLESTAGGGAESLACTDDVPRQVQLGSTTFRWRHRTRLEAQPPSGWSEWTAANGTSLLVPVPVLTTRSLEVLGVGLDFVTRWAGVTVFLTDTTPGAAPDIDRLELAAGRPRVVWTKDVHGGAPGTLSARLVFTSRLGQVVERTIEQVTGDQLIVVDPLEHARVRVGLMPAGTGWRDVSMVMVDLRYADGAFVVEEALELRGLQDFVEWEAPARPDGPRGIQWRVHASFRDGRFQTGGWQQSEAALIVVRLDGAPRREVQVIPLYFEASAPARGTLHFSSGATVETLPIEDHRPRVVSLPAGPFTWRLVWTSSTGQTIAESAPVEGDDVIVVPRFEGR